MKKLLTILSCLTFFNFFSAYSMNLRRKILLANVHHNIARRPLNQRQANIIGREVLRLTNKFRANQGLQRLQWNQDMFRVANRHANQMAQGSAPFNHNGLNGRFAQLSRRPKLLGENLFRGNIPHLRQAQVNMTVFRNDKPVILPNGRKKMRPISVNGVEQLAVQSWIHSEGHRKNLKRRDFNAGAIGVAKSPTGEWYMTQLLAKY